LPGCASHRERLERGILSRRTEGARYIAEIGRILGNVIEVSCKLVDFAASLSTSRSLWGRKPCAGRRARRRDSIRRRDALVSADQAALVKGCFGFTEVLSWVEQRPLPVFLSDMPRERVYSSRPQARRSHLLHRTATQPDIAWGLSRQRQEPERSAVDEKFLHIVSTARAGPPGPGSHRDAGPEGRRPDRKNGKRTVLAAASKAMHSTGPNDVTSSAMGGHALFPLTLTRLRLREGRTAQWPRLPGIYMSMAATYPGIIDDSRIRTARLSPDEKILYANGSPTSTWRAILPPYTP